MGLLTLAKEALAEEARQRLRPALQHVLTWIGGDTSKTPPLVAPSKAPTDEVSHKTVVDAMNETSMHIAQCRAETKERRRWAYIVTPDDEEKAAEFFGRPGAPTRVGEDSLKRRMVAVWMGKSPEPDIDPDFT